MISGDKVGLSEQVSYNLFPVQGGTAHALVPIRSGGWAHAGCPGRLSTQDVCPHNMLLRVAGGGTWCPCFHRAGGADGLMGEPIPRCEHQSVAQESFADVSDL